jgi:DNA-binding NtrC family response regulator
VERVLCIFAPGGVRTIPLGRSATLRLGRADDNDVPIDDRSVSRYHAKLHVDDALSIEDLGSANGIRIRRAQSSAETHEVVEERIPPNATVTFGLEEPITLGSVTLLVRSAEDMKPASVRRAAKPSSEASDVVAIAAETRRVFELATRIAAGPLAVLVTGETGVGKEVLAAHLHRASPRSSGPFVEVNAATLTESLAESELFGHERGAFTGAVGVKKGFFEAAQGGTLFLDEVGELSPALQAKLLRVLEAKKIVRVGGTQAIPIDVRVVAATHRDLAADVKSGRFRQDLYFRLNGITIAVPPLRDRREDIPALAERFAARTAEVMGMAAPTFTPAALEKLRSHGYPGNVRELRNVVDRACALAATRTIEPGDVIFDEPTDHDLDPVGDGPLKDTLAAETKRRILEALEACGGNQTKAAEKLGMPRRTLVARLSQYGMTKPRGR